MLSTQKFRTTQPRRCVMLMRFDPFREMDRLASQVASGRSPAMPMDAYRQGDQFFVHFDLPGVDPASVDLTVEKNVLSVTAERTWQHEEGIELVASERPQGRYTRQLFLGEGLDPDRIEASYEHGVLTVTVPVAEQAKPRKVEIASSGATAKAIDTGSTEKTSTAA
jgi:HSP20 family protein